MRARASLRISCPRRCAPRAPSPTPRARPTFPASRRCRTISATGGRRSNSCSARTAAARNWRRSRPLDFAQAAERARRRVLPARIRRVARCACRRRRGAIVDAGESDRHRAASRGETAKGTITARAAIVTVSTNVIAAGRIKFSPELPHRPGRHLRQAVARQLRPHRARTCGQSARSRQRRSGFREIGRHAHRRNARQCVRHAAVPDRSRRLRSAAICPRRAKPQWSISPANGWRGFTARK